MRHWFMLDHLLAASGSILPAKIIKFTLNVKLVQDLF